MLQLGTIGRGGREFASSSRFTSGCGGREFASNSRLKQTGLQSASKSYFNIRRAVRTVHAVSVRWHCLKTPATSSQHKSCVKVKVEVVVLGSTSYGLCGLEATSEEDFTSELMSCVKVKVAVLGSPSLIVLMVSVDLKQHLKKKKKTVSQSSGAV